MSITRYNPFFPALGDLWAPFRALEESVSKMRTEPAADRPWAPSVDIFECENEIIVKADLPDINEKDIDIRIEDGTLVLKGERKFEKEQKEGGFHRIERSYGTFARYFSLPETVDPDQVQAEYKNGVLKVTLAKKEAAKPKQIKIAVH
jgi:HSP20 family protein